MRKRQSRQELVSTYCTLAPGIGRGIIDTSSCIGVASSGHGTAIEIHGQPRAEHIVSCICDESRSDKLRSRIVRCGDGLGTITASKRAWVVGRPNEQFARGIFESCRHRHKREVDCSGPHAFASTRRRRCCLGGGVDVEFCSSGPWPTVASFGQGLYAHVTGLNRLEGRGLHGIIVDPSTEGYGGEGVSVGTRQIVSMF